MPPRRFPPPRTVNEHNRACFIVKDAADEALFVRKIRKIRTGELALSQFGFLTPSEILALGASMLSSKPEERRQAPRRRLGRVATIQLSDGNVQHYCLVTDISERGVQIHLNGFDVPDNFVLRFPSEGAGKSGNYEVVWRNGEDVGAEFVGSVRAAQFAAAAAARLE